MGMYTEVYVNVTLKKETDASVIQVLRNMTNGQRIEGAPDRWSHMFSNGSYYVSQTSVANLTFDEQTGQYSLLGKGDIKNYNGEIEQFFEFIKPWCDESYKFIGYYRYEEDREPTLIYLD